MDVAFLMSQNSLLKVDHKIVIYFNNFLNILKSLERLYMQKLWHKNLMACQMKVLIALLHQIIVLIKH